MTTWTVGQVADLFGVTVRTLHHYDEIGLLVPSERSRAGYRLYTDEDLTRLQQVVVYRRLEMPLDEIATLLEGGEDAADHLRRQRGTVMQRLDELTELVAAIDRALEREMNEQPATTEDLKELFGDGFEDEYQQEAQERWGETDAWKQSRSRTERYTKADWAEVKAEADAVNAAFVAALSSGEPATSERGHGRGRAAPAAHPRPLLRPRPHLPPGPRRHVRRRPALHEDVRGHRTRPRGIRPRRDPRQRRPARGAAS